MKPRLVGAPKNLPVTLDELKAALRVDFADDDAVLTSYLKAAVQHLDGFHGILGRAIINQDWQIAMRGWPYAGIIALPLGDVSAASLTFYDEDGVSQIVAAQSYELAETVSGAWLRLTSDFERPVLDKKRGLPIEVTFTAGFGDSGADVPEPIKVAIKMLAGHWYENREAVTGRVLMKTPMAVDRLLSPYRRVSI